MSTRGALRMFRGFHKREPREFGKFPPSFSIPKEVPLAGPARHVLYRSDKLNPTTEIDEGVIDYIHEHEKSVNIYRCDRGFDGPIRKVPKFILDAPGLVRLGECLGFAYVDEYGQDMEAKTTRPLPYLYCIPSGRALVVVSRSRPRVEALFWGGRLGVEPRGIVH